MDKSLIKRILVLFLFIVLLFIAFNFGCPIKRVFNIQCPACGTTHAWISLLQGNIAEAFRYNLFFWAYPIVICAFVFEDCDMFQRIKHKNAIIITFCVIVLIYSVLRNALN